MNATTTAAIERQEMYGSYFEWDDLTHGSVLRVICDFRAQREVSAFGPPAIPAVEIAQFVTEYGHDTPMWLGRVLNELRKMEYINRLRGGYVPTEKGKRLHAANLREGVPT